MWQYLGGMLIENIYLKSEKNLIIYTGREQKLEEKEQNSDGTKKGEIPSFPSKAFFSFKFPTSLFEPKNYFQTRFAAA